MAFIYKERDLVSFYRKKSFCYKDEIIHIYIDRGDETTLLNNIHLYMEKTNHNSSIGKILIRRPATPQIVF